MVQVDITESKRNKEVDEIREKNEVLNEVKGMEALIIIIMKYWNARVGKGGRYLKMRSPIKP